MGGTYVEGNAFYMNARAHFVAHLLLARIVNIPPLWNAIVSMGGVAGKTTSASYQRAKLAALPTLITHGIQTRDKKSGFHAFTKEMRKEHGHKSQLLKVGIFGPNADPKAAGKLGGMKIARAGVGIHTKESRSAAGKLGGAIVGKSLGLSQSILKRKCDVCGMIASPATLGAHQKAKKHVGWSSLS